MVWLLIHHHVGRVHYEESRANSLGYTTLQRQHGKGKENTGVTNWPVRTRKRKVLNAWNFESFRMNSASVVVNFGRFICLPVSLFAPWQDGQLCPRTRCRTCKFGAWAKQLALLEHASSWQTWEKLWPKATCGLKIVTLWQFVAQTISMVATIHRSSN